MPDATITQPAAGRTALLIIDMITEMKFDGASSLRPAAQAAAQAIARLRREADAAEVPVIYVNDNAGQWHSDSTRLIEHALRDDSPGHAVGRTLEPRADDYFVIKPQFSGFYATNLPVLLPRLQASRLILTGISADICVLFTAADAHMREYDLWVPRDAVASTSPERTGWALEIMEQSMHAETRPTTDLCLRDWLARA